MSIPICHSSENTPLPTIGTQEVGLTAGYLLPVRLKHNSESKQRCPAAMPSWMITLTDPIGQGWYQGQFSIGAEAVYIEFHEPVVSNGVGFTPKIKYSFVADDRIRPYVEFAGGPFWTDLGNRIPEQGSEWNFIVTAGVGCSVFITPRASINLGARFQHISCADTCYPNVGLNSIMPFGGFFYYF